MTDATPQPSAQPAPAPAAPLTPAEDKQWASFAHLGGILGILPSLIIYLIFKDRGTLTRQESKEALNFQITILGAEVAIFILSVILGAITFGIGSLIGGLGWIAWVVGVIFSIIGFTKVNGGQSYRYPFAVRFVK